MNKICYLVFTVAGVGFTGHIGEFFGELGIPLLLSLVPILEVTTDCTISLFLSLLNLDLNISNSRFRSSWTFCNMLFSNSWVRISLSNIYLSTPTAFPESFFKRLNVSVYLLIKFNY